MVRLLVGAVWFALGNGFQILLRNGGPWWEGAVLGLMFVLCVVASFCFTREGT